MDLSTMVKKSNISTDDLIKPLISRFPYERIQGIILVVKAGRKEKPIVRLLEQLTQDESVVMGYAVKEFATAAMNKLGIKKYDGKNQKIIRISNDGFDLFLK